MDKTQQNPDIIEQTIDFWTWRTCQDISAQDAREMIQNISGFFQVLSEWDRENENGQVEHIERESGE